MRYSAFSLLYAAALALGLMATFSPTIRSGFARMQTERGDGMLNHYILEHTWRSISEADYRGNLYDPPMFYPEPNTIWYSEHLFGVAPIYWALRLALPYDAAYQWWQIVLSVLNFVAFAAVVRWLRGSHVLAALGGYLWAFGLVHIDQLNHQQMIPRFCMPLALYHAWKCVFTLHDAATYKALFAHANEPQDIEHQNRTSRVALHHLNGMCAAVFVQAISCVNTGWFLVVGIATFLLLALTFNRGVWRELFRFLLWRRGRAVLVLAIWSAALVAAYVPYIVVNRGLSRQYAECYGLIPTPSAWITGPVGSVWRQFTARFRLPVLGECKLFCGFGLYVLMVVALLHTLIRGLRKPRPMEWGMIAAALLTAILWFAFAFTPENGGPSLWQFVRKIPGGTAIRVVSRVYVLVYLFGTIGALVWLSRVTESLLPRRQFIIHSTVALFCIMEQQGYSPPSFDKRDFYAIADRAAVEARKGDIAYVVPRYTDTKGEVLDWVYGEVMGMWVGMKANVPVVNGYSGRTPHVTHPSLEVASDEKLRAWLEGGFRGRVAIVDPDHPESTRILEIP